MIRPHLVMDVEIQKEISEVSGWGDTDKLGVSCAVTYNVDTDRWRVYSDTSGDLRQLRRDLMMARRITGFNIWKFDFPVVFGLPGEKRVIMLQPQCDDLLMRIWNGAKLNPFRFNYRTHGGYSLDKVCSATLGHKKSGSGAEAPRLYKRREWGKLISYCIHDVWLTVELMKYIQQHRSVNANGKRIPVESWTPDQIKDWQK